VPHSISVAYDPNWRVEGAFGVFLASPSFMMVVPQQPVVRLRFRRSATDWMGILATLAGIGLCFAMPRQSAETSVGLPPVASRRFHLAVRVLLTIALAVIAVSVIRKIGSQYFFRRAWHAFETQDFARARREYDRTLFFGRSYALSADAMFWRASSLFRMDDCAAAGAGVRGGHCGRPGERVGSGEPIPDRHLPGPPRPTRIGGGGFSAHRRAVRAQPMVGRGRRSLAGDPSHTRTGAAMTRVPRHGGDGVHRLGSGPAVGRGGLRAAAIGAPRSRRRCRRLRSK
jgi:hypothetical protein